MNRTVHSHLRSILPDDPQPDSPVLLGGGARPNKRIHISMHSCWNNAKQNLETGKQKSWLLKDLRKTYATYYDEHVPESSIEMLGHSVGNVTYRNYAHRAPLAF